LAGATPDEGGYRVAVQLDMSTIEVDGRAVPLRSGMAAQVDVATDRRQVLKFLLDPIAKHIMEAAHEHLILAV
jgi:multidrug efflux pump subunit AcrA (membrane-fusion protein)